VLWIQGLVVKIKCLPRFQHHKYRVCEVESHTPATSMEVVAKQRVNTSLNSILAWSMHNFKPRGGVIGDEDRCFPSIQSPKNIDFWRAKSWWSHAPNRGINRMVSLHIQEHYTVRGLWEGRCQVGERGVAGREAPSWSSKPELFDQSLIDIGERSIISP
jgi:hypothetical protein